MSESTEQPRSVDLDALRIDHGRASPTRSGSSRIWPVLFFLLLIVSGTAIAFLWMDRDSSQLPVVRVERLAAPKGTGSGGSFSAAGWIKLPLSFPVHVTPLTAGRLEEVAVVEGDVVKQGQLLARLYDGDLRATLAAAEARLAAAAAEADKARVGYRDQEVAEAAAEIVRLEAELDNARQVLVHSRQLAPSGAISREELLADETAVKTFEASLQKARERHSLMQEGYRSEDVALALAGRAEAEARRDLAALELGYATIESPIDGVVLTRAGRVGQWITPGAGPVLSLFDPARLEARVDVNQDDLAKIFLGQKVEMTSRAWPNRPRKGEVVLVEPQADLVKNTVPVRVRIAPEENAAEGSPLYPDMVVTAVFRRAESQDGSGAKPAALTVPVVAIRDPQGAPYVLLVRTGVLQRQDVRLGELAGGRYVIVQGLRGGEQVVIDTECQLAPGTEVRIAQ